MSSPHVRIFNMKKVQKKRAVLSVLGVLGLLVLGFIIYVSGVVPLAYKTVQCGGLPVESSNFAASYSYKLPGDRDYGLNPFGYYEFCTAAEAEREGYSRNTLLD